MLICFFYDLFTKLRWSEKEFCIHRKQHLLAGHIQNAFFKRDILGFLRHMRQCSTKPNTVLRCCNTVHIPIFFNAV